MLARVTKLAVARASLATKTKGSAALVCLFIQASYEEGGGKPLLVSIPKLAVVRACSRGGKLRLTEASSPANTEGGQASGY